MRQNQNFYKSSQNSYGQQTAPPGYANNQRAPQKYSLELFNGKLCYESNQVAPRAKESNWIFE